MEEEKLFLSPPHSHTHTHTRRQRLTRMGEDGVGVGVGKGKDVGIRRSLIGPQRPTLRAANHRRYLENSPGFILRKLVK